jgi:hypothetical protein
MTASPFLAEARNPVFALPYLSVRDPAALHQHGVFHLYYTVFNEATMEWHIGQCRTRDFRHFTPTELITPEGYASPGNAIRVGNEWWLCVQSYGLRPEERAAGRRHPGGHCRLWWLKSSDLQHWSEPVLISAEGCTSKWADSPRQIDPYVLETKGQYLLYFKASGATGCWRSSDLAQWDDFSPDRPLISAESIRAGVTVENVCVFEADGLYHMCYSPCRPARGLCMATSRDLRQWEDQGEIPTQPIWALGGFTAHFVMDLRQELGGYLMLFHGDRCDGAHPDADVGKLGLGWSADLSNWCFP